MSAISGGKNFMRRFAFVSEAAAREYKALPEHVQDEFGKDLRRIQYGDQSALVSKPLAGTVGPGALELVLNGSPAYRCVYIVKFADTLFVLHSFIKTTNRTDRRAMAVAQSRLKELMCLLRESRVSSQ